MLRDLDSCKEMIDATENLLDRSGLSGRVRTVLADYLDWSGEAGQEYDLALAIGVLDYVDDAGTYLASLRHVAQEVIVTFPAKYMFSFMASFSYRQHGIRAYFYTQEQIRRLLERSRLRDSAFYENISQYILGPCKTKPNQGRTLRFSIIRSIRDLYMTEIIEGTGGAGAGIERT